MKIAKLSSTLAFFAGSVQAIHNILDYGAVPELEDTASAYKNGDAIAAAIEAAN